MVLKQICLCLQLLLLDISVSQNVCDVELFVDADHIANITSTNYPNELYSPGESKAWCASAPPNVTLLLVCDMFHVPKSVDCEVDALVVSSSTDEPRSFCGHTPFQVETSSNNIIVTFYSNKKSRAGKFYCQVRAEGTQALSFRTVEFKNCDCGYSYSLRVVGGVETGINEFPFMAGLVDARRGATIVCGATIISQRYVLTAEHCLATLDIKFTAIIVGEHNIETGSETSAAKLIQAKRFVHYPYYNNKSRQYDIAIIELHVSISYSARVGPVCLPFMSRNWDITGQQVTIIGWGTTEFGGPRSKYLRKAYVDIIDITNCINSYGYDIEPNTQLCAYKKNSDACQYDSGGPLVWLNPYIGRYELVGLVSYGRGCASVDPSVNTKVAPFIKWILDFTPGEIYCYLN